MKTRVKAGRTVQQKPPPAPDPSVAPLVAARLAVMGYVQGPNESPAEMIAKWMGISSRKLRAELERRAAGLRKLPIWSV